MDKAKTGKIKRGGMPQRAIGLQLHPVKDLDILEWLSNRPDNNKQGAIKAAIRAAMARECEALPDDDLPAGHDETLATLSEWLGGMKTYLDERFSALPTAAQIDQLVRSVPARSSEPVAETILPELKIAIKKSMKQGLKLEG